MARFRIVLSDTIGDSVPGEAGGGDFDGAHIGFLSWFVSFGSGHQRNDVGLEFVLG